MADPFLWLEDIEGERALSWVRAQNERSLKQLTSDPRAMTVFIRPRSPSWKTRAAFLRRNSRRVDLQLLAGRRERARRVAPDAARFRTSCRSPEWETLLDLDALAKKEDRNWVWKGATCMLAPGERCMVRLSNGGKDAQRAARVRSCQAASS